MTRQQAIDKALSIDGWLSKGEATALFDLAATAVGPIVEIGSWRGRSTAALALGSMSGNKQPVFAVDSFDGVPPVDRPTAQGIKPGWNSSTPEQLRSNLDSVGVNGLVKIVAKASADAACEIPQCGLLFVDGDHEYEAVLSDLEQYLPKVALGGTVVLHDCSNADPGVVRAVDEMMTANPMQWRCRGRIDSALIFERRESVQHKVLLGFPGTNLCYGSAMGLMQSSLGVHDVSLEQSGLGWDDMNRLWCWALNCAAKGKYTHFAMLHSDITPSPGWIDLLIDELDDRDGDFIGAVAALKNEDGLTSCGIGDASNPWAPFRRFTMRELMRMPETFSIADTEYPEKYLLHNSGCFVLDLRKRLWRRTDANGCLHIDFSFPIRGRLLPTGEMVHERESEDWHFSRKMAEQNAKSFATRRVSTIHFGQKGFRNDYAWGRMEHDEATRDKWQPQ